MTTGLYKKGMVLAIICLFIGASVIPSVGGKSQRTFPSFTRERTIFSSLEEPDIEVNDDGGDVDFTLIQKAINYANDGDVIWVYTGQYPENLDIIDKNITLIGKSYEKYDPDNIIEKPIINAETEDDDTAIYIKNAKCTISDFTIKNGKFMAICIYNSGNNTITGNTIKNNNGGIRLWKSSDNSITGNTISDNEYSGISLYESSDNSITGNTIKNNNGGGIGLSYLSDNNSITGNTISDNNGRGIEIFDSSNNSISKNTISDNNGGCILILYESSDNSITGNTIKNNGRGIYIGDSSDNNSITGNTISNNKYYGIMLADSIYINIINNILNSGGIVIYGNSLVHFTTHTIENNMANDKPIRYYKNAEDIDVPKNSAQIILANCINFTIQELDDISNVSIGIQILFSSNITISKNTISNNKYYGIRLQDSSDNNITGNTISNNKYYGIGLSNSSGNSITGNTISNNKYYGIGLSFSSSFNSITGNTISNNNGGGIYIGNSSDNSITGNTIKNNDDDGIMLYYSSNNFIIDNNLSYNNLGIYLHESFGNKIFHNNFLENHYDSKDYGENIWYDSTLQAGNYWSDYKDKYPDAMDEDNDGIWDDPYHISGGANLDIYPFVKPLSQSSPFKPTILSCDQGYFVKKGVPCIFTFKAIDPEEQNVSYSIDWGDGKYFTTKFYNSGEVVEEQHNWDEKGSYEVRIKAIDETGRTSEWGEPWKMTVIKSKTKNHPFLNFLENHPHMFPTLRQLLGL